jgi:hypothetical protein
MTMPAWRGELPFSCMKFIYLRALHFCNCNDLFAILQEVVKITIEWSVKAIAIGESARTPLEAMALNYDPHAVPIANIYNRC